MGDNETDTMTTNTEHSGRVTYRDVSDGYARLEREMREGNARLEGKIDAYMLQHEAKHQSEQKVMADHLLNSAIMGERAQVMVHDVEAMERELTGLRDWRSEMRGMANLVKFAVGTSIIGAIVSLLTLVNIVQNGF